MTHLLFNIFGHHSWRLSLSIFLLLSSYISASSLSSSSSSSSCECLPANPVTVITTANLTKDSKIIDFTKSNKPQNVVVSLSISPDYDYDYLIVTIDFSHSLSDYVFSISSIVYPYPTTPSSPFSASPHPASLHYASYASDAPYAPYAPYAHYAHYVHSAIQNEAPMGDYTANTITTTDSVGNTKQTDITKAPLSFSVFGSSSFTPPALIGMFRASNVPPPANPFIMNTTRDGDTKHGYVLAIVVDIQDVGAGFANGVFVFSDPLLLINFTQSFSSSALIAGTIFNGTYEIDMAFPTDSTVHNANYTDLTLMLYDQSHRHTKPSVYTSVDFLRRGFQFAFSVIGYPSHDLGIDIELMSMSISSSSSSSSSTLNSSCLSTQQIFTIGIKRTNIVQRLELYGGDIRFPSPSPSPAAVVYWYPSITDHDGSAIVYVNATINVPRGSPNSVWKFDADRAIVITAGVPASSFESGPGSISASVSYSVSDLVKRQPTLLSDVSTIAQFNIVCGPTAPTQNPQSNDSAKSNSKTVAIVVVVVVVVVIIACIATVVLLFRHRPALASRLFPCFDVGNQRTQRSQHDKAYVALGDRSDSSGFQ